MQLQNIIEQKKAKSSTEDEFAERFMSNYIKNKMLNDLVTELENIKSKKNEPESISFKEIEEESKNEVTSKSSEEIYSLPKSKIKTRGKFDITRLHSNIKIWKENNLIDETQQQFFTKLKILERINQSKIKNNFLIEEMYSICSNEVNNVIFDKQIEELSRLSDKLEISKTQQQYYDDSTLPATVLLPKKLSESIHNQKTYEKNLYFKKTTYDPSMIYNLNRDVSLDHEYGRPAIYLGFNEKTKQHKLIFGTSQNLKDKNEILALNVSKKTYFYSENVLSFKDEDIKTVLKDFWSRNYDSNVPVDFLNKSDKEKIENFFCQLNTQETVNQQQCEDSSGMSEYYDEYKKQHQENSNSITTQSSISNEQQNSEQSQFFKQNNKFWETSKKTLSPLSQSYNPLTQKWIQQDFEKNNVTKQQKIEDTTSMNDYFANYENSQATNQQLKNTTVHTQALGKKIEAAKQKNEELMKQLRQNKEEMEALKKEEHLGDEEQRNQLKENQLRKEVNEEEEKSRIQTKNKRITKTLTS